MLMNEVELKTYLEENEIDSQLITIFLDHMRKYDKYLARKNINLATSPPEQITEYSEFLVLSDKESVLDFLRSIIHYARFTKKYELITKVIDISESYNAMDTLYSRVAEYYGETLRDEIFKDLTVPPLGVNPEKKPEFTKIVLKRLEDNLGKEEIVDLLSPCLHGRPPDDIEGDRRILKELGIDGFLKKKHQDLIARLEKHRNEGTLEFAQKIDDEVIKYVKENQTIAEGVREGNMIFVSKLPYQTREFLDAKDDKMKRYFLCYCPWIRGALKNGTEKEITEDFCHCSAGWYKLYWDQLFEQSVVVNPVHTALKGALECKFVITIPETILQ